LRVEIFDGNCVTARSASLRYAESVPYRLRNARALDEESTPLQDGGEHSRHSRGRNGLSPYQIARPLILPDPTYTDPPC
jgi:hypothetical protein